MMNDMTRVMRMMALVITLGMTFVIVTKHVVVDFVVAIDVVFTD